MSDMIQTPHISAKKGSFAKTVLMPGDPLRAKYVAENFLENAELVNNVRGVQGHTGFYGGKRVSVMASGMGVPSMGIYAYELFEFCGVENIIRIGSAGAISTSLKLKDIVLASAACTNSDFAAQYRLPGTFAPAADFGLLSKTAETAKRLGMDAAVGTVLTSDTFYDDAKSALSWQKMNVLAVEMECAALYMTAARCGKKALCICSISDFVFDEQSLSAEERQSGFTQMIRLALEAAE